MDMVAMKRRVLVATDNVVIPVSVVFSAVERIGVHVSAEDDVLVATRATPTIRGKLPIEPASMDGAISLMKTPELVGEQWIEEIARVLKPEGKILIQTSLSCLQLTDDKPSFGLDRKLLMAGFLEVQTVQIKAMLPIEADGDQLLTIKGKKASWKIGSSFSLKKATNTAPKIQIDDSLLTEEDLKKPQLPPGLMHMIKSFASLEIVKLEARGRPERRTACTCGRPGKSKGWQLVIIFATCRVF